jgi:hypothetical protein
VTLTQCPYDGTPIEIEHLSGGSMTLSCPTCGVLWERHGGWVSRLREPDWQKVITVRRAPRSTEHREGTRPR